MRRSWLVVVLALVALGAGAAVGWAAWRGDDHDDYTQRLEQYPESGEPHVFVNLPDGEAQLALGSPDGHRLVVQWRDPDGHGWTKPETVYEDSKLRAIENTVRYGGGTVGIVETYVPDTNEDNDDNAVYIAVVCRDLVCDATESLTTEAQVTPDGATAFLGSSPTGALFWDSTDGFHEAAWRNHPGFDASTSSTSEPVLAPDGSLRVVGSRPARGDCTYELYTSEPGAAALTASARVTTPLRGRARSDCRSSLRTWSDSWVEVNDPELRAATVWFVRDGDAWTSTTEDASGLAQIDVRGCCDTYAAGFIHWNSVAFGSPDGQRIQVQSHLLGDEQWSEPVVLDGAPPRSRCTSLDGFEAGPKGFALVLSCRGGVAVAASADLRDWTSTYLPGVTGEALPDDEGLRIGGELVWSPDDGFVD